MIFGLLNREIDLQIICGAKIFPIFSKACKIFDKSKRRSYTISILVEHKRKLIINQVWWLFPNFDIAKYFFPRSCHENVVNKNCSRPFVRSPLVFFFRYYESRSVDGCMFSIFNLEWFFAWFKTKPFTLVG